VIATAVRRYLRYGLSYRDVEELLAERGIKMDHVTITGRCRRSRRSSSTRPDGAAMLRVIGGSSMKPMSRLPAAGRTSTGGGSARAGDRRAGLDRRDSAAARRFFARAHRFRPVPVEVVTDRAPVYPRLLKDLMPAARHVTERYASNCIEADHGRLTARLRPMRGLKRLASARAIAAGHAFVQNLRRGHYAITADLHMQDRVRVASDELAMVV
jgi:transposase-like protein